MKGKFFAAVVVAVASCMFGAGCGSSEIGGDDFDPPEIPAYCVLNSECEGLRDVCVYPECVDNVCTVRDLTDPEVPLPIDTESGLPLGKHCRGKN